MTGSARAVRLAGVLGLAACSGGPRPVDPIFVDGRAVTAVGDSLIAFTRQGDSGVIVRDRRSGEVVRHGARALASPHQIQQVGGRWYVSDTGEAGARLVVFTSGWEVEREVALAGVASAPHQFAVLPDGRIVVEAPDGRLVVAPLDPTDTSATFALVERGPIAGLVVGVAGGILHAVPQRHLTLYNEHGNIRWRVSWPWRDDAFVTDIAVDVTGRIHVLAGAPAGDGFVCFTVSAATGEVVRWSGPGPAATFTVDRVGEISPDSSARWTQ
jgi:hypothetical protein